MAHHALGHSEVKDYLRRL